MTNAAPARGRAGAIHLDVRALVAAWTGDRPSPEFWIETDAIQSARREIEKALGSRPDPILITGPSGRGKSHLLRSLWYRPLSGYAPTVVPSSTAEPDRIAAQILSATRAGQVHDADAALTRLFSAKALRGDVPVLLIDDLHSMPHASLSHLLSIADASRVEVRVIAAGLEGPALEAVVPILPGRILRVEIADSWTRADAERLITRIAEAIKAEPEKLLAQIDIDEVIRACDGNPRLVRAALAQQLDALGLDRLKAEQVSAPATAPEVPASSERVDSAAVPPIASWSSARVPLSERMAPLRAGLAQPTKSGVRLLARLFASRPDVRLRGSSKHARQITFAGIAACIAIAWLFDRGFAIAAWSAGTASAYRADVLRRADASAPPESAAVQEPVMESAEVDVEAAPVETAPVEPAEPPIRVAVNSDPWAEVQVDGIVAGTTPFTLELTPGLHRFRAVMADGRVVEQDHEIAPGRDRVVFRQDVAEKSDKSARTPSAKSGSGTSRDTTR